MSRPKGSLNKKTIEKMSKQTRRNNLQVLNFDKQIANTAVCKTNQMYNIVNFGEKNDYTYKLLDLYTTSVTMNACVEFATNAIVGTGLDTEAMGEELINPNYYTDWFTFLRALAWDFVMYNAFSFQIVKNRDNKTYSFFYQSVADVRMEEMDEDGVVQYAQLSRDWTNPVKYPPVRLPLFGFQEEKEIPRGEVYLFYYHRQNTVNPYYGIPAYVGSISSIQSEAAYQIYDLKTISNGFTPSGVLTLNAVETDEERQAVIRNVTAMFTGSENAANIMITFRENDEQQAPEFTPFSAANSHVDLYAAANDRTVNRIMAGFRIPTAALIGYPCDDTGFSNSGEFLESAFALYNVNVANQNRNELLTVINEMFKMNGVDVEIKLKPLRYRIDNEPVINDTPKTSDTQGVEEEEATEKEKNT